MKSIRILALILVTDLGVAASEPRNDGQIADGGDVVSRGSGNQRPSTRVVRIRIVFGAEAVTVRMHDNATSRDLLTLLPLRLTFKDYASTEKVADLPRRLSTEGAPPGSDPSVGDFAYYAPWGNLAIFYRDFGYSSGLVVLGAIESGIEKLARMSGDVVVTIERVE
jgi:hypothetical protein